MVGKYNRRTWKHWCLCRNWMCLFPVQWPTPPGFKWSGNPWTKKPRKLWRRRWH